MTRVLAKPTITIRYVAISAMQLRNSLPRTAPLATEGISTVSWRLRGHFTSFGNIPNPASALRDYEMPGCHLT